MGQAKTAGGSLKLPYRRKAPLILGNQIYLIKFENLLFLNKYDADSQTKPLTSFSYLLEILKSFFISVLRNQIRLQKKRFLFRKLIFSDFEKKSVNLYYFGTKTFTENCSGYTVGNEKEHLISQKF